MPATSTSAADTAPRYRHPDSALEGFRTADGINVRSWAHPTIPVILVRADLANISLGLDLTAADARRLAGYLLAGADELDQR